jgi:hypothetical protein|tara:strand:- start:848 stop:1006 length:159 start_codon:yes stop_codon:yes gene_type:complete
MNTDWIDELLCEEEEFSTSEIQKLKKTNEIEYLKRLTVNYSTQLDESSQQIK